MSSTPLASNSGFMAKYMALEQPRDKILVAYVYLCPGGDGLAHLSSKSKVVNFVPESASQLPIWDMAIPVGTKLVEIFIRPVQLYADPFRGGNNKLVLCELLTADMKPLSNNYRYSCNEAMELARDQHPWFGVEQEYYLMDSKTNWPLGWPKNGYPEPLASPHAFHYGAVGANNQYGRDVMEAHLRACLYAGINICGENAEGQPSQWEYQVGPCEGIKLGDDLIMSRYILHRVAEDLHIGVSIDPKPVPGWLANGAHTNFSTEAMRAEGGLVEIRAAMEKLSKTHDKHMKVYDPLGGKDNARRLTGFWSSKADEFTWGEADKAASVRIPMPVVKAGKGYFEDRRPASNCDPYAVTEALVRTCCLNEF